MNLILTGKSYLQSDYTNSTGQIIYRVQTPHPYSWTNKTTTITRVIDSEAEISIDNQSQGDPLEGRFGHLAQIDWKLSGEATIRFKGDEINTKEFFKMKFWGWQRYRRFTASDGKEYKWKLGSTASTLLLDDGSDTRIARFHEKPWRITKPEKYAYLEICPGGVHMVDEILVQFLFIESVRQVRQQATNA